LISKNNRLNLGKFFNIQNSNLDLLFLGTKSIKVVYSFLKNKIFLDSKNLTYTSLDFNLGFIENHPDY
jgi:hypothetical protein